MSLEYIFLVVCSSVGFYVEVVRGAEQNWRLSFPIFGMLFSVMPMFILFGAPRSCSAVRWWFPNFLSSLLTLLFLQFSSLLEEYDIGRFVVVFSLPAPGAR